MDYYPLFSISAISTVVLVILLFSFNQYRHKRNLFDVDESIAITKSIILTSFIIIFFTYLSRSSAQYSRFVILGAFLLGLVIIVFSRYTLRELLGILRVKGFNIKKACIFDDSKTKKLIYNKIKDNKKLGYKIVKSINEAEVAFVNLKDQNKLLNLISSYPDVEFKIIPDVIETITEPAKFDEFVDIPLITIKERSTKHSYLFIKRSFDIIFSLLFLILFSPLFILIIIINFFSFGNVFFIQKRVGKSLKQFKFYKFQTMKPIKKPKNEVDYLFKAKNDLRVTNFGKILRRTCLDELPQLFNILKGDMSFVGPRPHLKQELNLFKEWKKKRFSVKPGLTGLWQVSGRHDLNLDKTAMLDLYYINHMSLSLDLKIILKTIPAIIFSRGRW